MTEAHDIKEIWTNSLTAFIQGKAAVSENTVNITT